MLGENIVIKQTKILAEPGIRFGINTERRGSGKSVFADFAGKFCESDNTAGIVAKNPSVDFESKGFALAVIEGEALARGRRIPAVGHCR